MYHLSFIKLYFMNKNNYLFGFALVAIFGNQSCKKDHDHDHDESELITTVKISLTSPSGTVVSASWKDLTPNEPLGQTVGTLNLDSGLVYNGKVELLDETKTPADDISAEVKKEADDHLFVYQQVPGNPEIITIEATDKDSKNLPLGLEFKLTAINKGAGKLNIVLKHQPGEKDGNRGPGDEDFNIEIPFVSKGK
jgi:hypothetical protein